jgi:hypothetical protein
VTLGEESNRTTELLRGKVVSFVVRHRDREVMIQFEDGTRLFIDAETALELSIEGKFGEED